jgi:hypothetical protein
VRLPSSKRFVSPLAHSLRPILQPNPPARRLSTELCVHRILCGLTEDAWQAPPSSYVSKTAHIWNRDSVCYPRKLTRSLPAICASSNTSLIPCMLLNRWWPGTELNRRRQPFQGCALPPELPGHFLSANRRATTAVDCALSLDGEAAKNRQPIRGERAELRNYNNPAPFTQNPCESLDVATLSVRPSSHGIESSFTTPFRIVSTQWFAPNQ